MEYLGLPIKRADAVSNRARIIEVALAVFAERGLDMEMGEIASRADLGIGTLYRHFANREDLLRAILTHTVNDTLAQFRAAVAETIDDPRAALLAFVSVGLRVQQQYGPIFAVIRDPKLRKIFDQTQAQAFRDQFLEVVLGILAGGIKANLFRSDLDQELVAATIMGSILGVSDLFETRWSVEELAQKLFLLHLAMLTRNVTGES
ncbi:MAG: TetR/AcrR family transcriptional regulator [Ktedonobacteraceae bacterium]